MIAIKQWATIVCVSAVITCLIEMLTPSGKMKKMVLFVLGLFMLCAVFIPLINTVTGLTTELGELKTNEVQNDFRCEIQESFSEQAKDKIKQLTEELLKKNNIDYKKIDVYMDINEDFSISIIRINITVDFNDITKISNIKSLVENNLGIEATVETV